jgi:hypothetical protein
MNRHGMTGIVSAGITRYDTEAFGENVNNLAFAFITPLGANNYG